MLPSELQERFMFHSCTLDVDDDATLGVEEFMAEMAKFGWVEVITTLEEHKGWSEYHVTLARPWPKKGEQIFPGCNMQELQARVERGECIECGSPSKNDICDTCQSQLDEESRILNEIEDFIASKRSGLRRVLCGETAEVQ